MTKPQNSLRSKQEAFSDGHVVFLKFNLIILTLIFHTFKRVQLNQGQKHLRTVIYEK
jgi:hypothetical protein